MHAGPPASLTLQHLAPKRHDGQGAQGAHQEAQRRQGRRRRCSWRRRLAGCRGLTPILQVAARRHVLPSACRVAGSPPGGGAAGRSRAQLCYELLAAAQASLDMLLATQGRDAIGAQFKCWCAGATSAAATAAASASRLSGEGLWLC